MIGEEGDWATDCFVVYRAWLMISWQAMFAHPGRFEQCHWDLMQCLSLLDLISEVSEVSAAHCLTQAHWREH